MQSIPIRAPFRYSALPTLIKAASCISRMSHERGKREDLIKLSRIQRKSWALRITSAAAAWPLRGGRNPSIFSTSAKFHHLPERQHHGALICVLCLGIRPSEPFEALNDLGFVSWCDGKSPPNSKIDTGECGLGPCSVSRWDGNWPPLDSITSKTSPQRRPTQVGLPC